MADVVVPAGKSPEQEVAVQKHEAKEDDYKDYGELVDKLRGTFIKRELKDEDSYTWRLTQLRALRKMVSENEPKWVEAMNTDLGRTPSETYLAEFVGCYGEIDHAISNLKSWMEPKKVSTHLLAQPGSSYLYPEPLGVVLIIAPWNYPLLLQLAPLVGAIAGGNCAILKPSEISAATGKLFAELVPQYLDTESFTVEVLEPKGSTELLKVKFDLIFFTGSTNVGRIVMQAAAKHLCPVILELGGKSPCIIDRNVDVKLAARRITWGKFFNCGQTCIAPDYILVDADIEEELVKHMKRFIEEFYTSDPKTCTDYPRIVSERRTRTLANYLRQDGENQDFVVDLGGLDTVDVENRYIAPTILRNVSPDCKVMQDEIFGPICPILSVKDIDEAISFVNARPKPLALYVFSKDNSIVGNVLNSTSSGGVCVNDVMMHVAVPTLQFGGVGMSGMGSYHGKNSFDCFTHSKPVLWRTSGILDAKHPRYPPYTDSKDVLMKRTVSLASCSIL